MDSRDNERNDLQEIMDKTLEDMGRDVGGTLRPDDADLAEFARRSGPARSKDRTPRAKGFRATKHGRCGTRAAATVMTGHAEVADELLRGGVTNSSVIFDRLRDDGYEGGLTTVRDYVRSHMHLVPAKRKAVVPRGSRGERYETGPGEAFQMDRGFARVAGPLGREWRIACFAMVCRHCGTCYVEFFPNARQENLLVGMVHAFMAPGIPKRVPADNMRSVVIRRDGDGRPVWQSDHAALVACVGFGTSLREPRHPSAKGKVERLVRFARGNFLAGREFADITEPDAEALSWCAEQGDRYRPALGLVPADEHGTECLPATRPLEVLVFTKNCAEIAL